jgi:Dna[CI] antecedent, DciA
MEEMRDVLRATLGRSLRRLGEVDRLAAAWPVTCGRAMAQRGAVVGYENGVVRIEVESQVWLQQMRSLRSVLAREMAKIAEVPVREIHFEVRQDLTGGANGRQ